MSKKIKPVAAAGEDAENVDDFSSVGRGAVIDQPGKTRITMWIDIE